MTEVKAADKCLGVLSFRLLLFLILLQPVANAFGQNTLIKGGLSVSSVAGLSETTSLTGYHLGIGGLKDLSRMLALRHELIFSQQGTRVTEDHKLVYYYLNMPILLNLQFGEKFSLDIGPQLGVALKALEKGETDRDITANLNTVDISACIGVNYLISENFFAQGRFNLGITNVSRIAETRAYRNAVFQGSVGYYFNRKNEQPE